MFYSSRRENCEKYDTSYCITTNTCANLRVRSAREGVALDTVEGQERDGRRKRRGEGSLLSYDWHGSSSRSAKPVTLSRTVSDNRYEVFEKDGRSRTVRTGKGDSAIPSDSLIHVGMRSCFRNPP